ncbi:MAG TPA: CPBP family intramembrane metalloprotease [Ligilactobacillus acidipiscis]|uniref:CPBP family intramembrane metalloprotease n=1 Tax=Ligilactobacillus acidipiscis TaxID=89059 RepID=A0A921F6U6_9LACO|nr:CPBP family intramembrane metalloprotease [Ligilactobacillus acidipiscis]
MFIESHWSWGRQLYWGMILFLLFFFSNMFFYDTSLVFKVSANLIIALIALFITFKSMGTFKVINVKLKFNQLLVLWGVLAVLAVTIMLFVGHTPTHILQVFNSKHIFLSTTAAISSAILEEAITRGLFFAGFIGLAIYHDSSYKLTKAAVYSSLLFGGLHIFNLVGGTLETVMQQVFYACAFGMFLAALRITTNGLTLPILFHFLIDWVPLDAIPSTSGGSWGVTLAIFIPILLLSTMYLVYVDRQLMLQPNKS